ncbi:MAG: zinc ribbon domain-containing protein [Bacteroidota bacterium]
MATNDQSNCVNCGAKLDVTTGQIKCAYCGTVVTDALEDVRSNELNQIHQQITVPVNPTDNETNNGCAPVIIVSLFLALFLGILIYSQNKGNGTSGYTDSVAIDTTTEALLDSVKTNIPEETGQQRANKETLKELSSITVNLPTFKKLYKNARKQKDKFSGKTFIYDQTSPAYVNRSGVFLYISAEPKEDYYPLRYATQYYGDDWLFIENMVFNTDGKNATPARV